MSKIVEDLLLINLVHEVEILKVLERNLAIYH